MQSDAIDCKVKGGRNVDRKMSPIELGLVAQRSRHPYIRQLGRMLLGKEPLVITSTPAGMMPAQLELISKIKKAIHETTQVGVDRQVSGGQGPT